MVSFHKKHNALWEDGASIMENLTLRENRRNNLVLDSMIELGSAETPKKHIQVKSRSRRIKDL